jgi:pimeloyl-ACP methyl ester carboxylesterase
VRRPPVAYHRLPADDDVVKVPDIGYARNGENVARLPGRRGRSHRSAACLGVPLQPALRVGVPIVGALHVAARHLLPPHPDGPPGIRTLRPLPESPPFETTLQDLEVVLDEAGSAKATLFGLWDGCATSILFGATHPERVSSLILFSASPVQTSKDDYSFAWDRTR